MARKWGIIRLKLILFKLYILYIRTYIFTPTHKLFFLYIVNVNKNNNIDNFVGSDKRIKKSA